MELQSMNVYYHKKKRQKEKKRKVQLQCTLFTPDDYLLCCKYLLIELPKELRNEQMLKLLVSRASFTVYKSKDAQVNRFLYIIVHMENFVTTCHISDVL